MAIGSSLAFQNTPENPSEGRQQAGYYLRSPYSSLEKTSVLLSNFALKLQLLYGYREAEDSDHDWRGASLSNVLDFRGFLRKDSEDNIFSLEAVVTPYPEGGFEILMCGFRGDQTVPNPDLDQAFSLLESLSGELQAEIRFSDLEKLGYEVYHLSYIHADRAVALLKVLNYTTVEYNEEQGDNISEKIYTPIQKGTGKFPVVVKLLDSTKTSLLDPVPGAPIIADPKAKQQTGPSQKDTSTAVPDIGGTYLHQMTSGEPQQRLMIVFEKDDPDSLEDLLNLLREKIDVPARQIVIEALVIELNTDRLKDLGVSWGGTSGKFEMSFGSESADSGKINPFTFTFDSTKNAIDAFNFSLQALVESGDAEILSKPSVLVLDGRQARIQIGQQVPVVKSTSTQAGIISSVDYFPVGIVLNLRPRISEDGTEITLQAETIVSAVNQLASAEASGTEGVLLAPVVDNRQVQTFVRVADNSPFIIGGLISTERRKQVKGIPFLSDIPALGILFRRTITENSKREVIVVLTPHVVPPKEKTFSYVIPKDSDRFDSFGYNLFRNSYRLRGQDVFDLGFVYESNIFRNLVVEVEQTAKKNRALQRQEPFKSLLEGGVPGEEVLIRRMLWEIIDKTDYAENIPLERIIFFQENPEAADGTGFQLQILQDHLPDLEDLTRGTLLKFKAQAIGTHDHPFVQPTAQLHSIDISSGAYLSKLIQENRRDRDGNPVFWSILLSNSYAGIRVSPVELLKGVLALKRILELNQSLPLTIRDFYVGRQITFPSEEELQNRYHVIDKDAARLFYEIVNYYPVFEEEFNRQTRDIRAKLMEPGTAEQNSVGSE
jgi:Flp pilus assembly secretin CpaC